MIFFEITSNNEFNEDGSLQKVYVYKFGWWNTGDWHSLVRSICHWKTLGMHAWNMREKSKCSKQTPSFSIITCDRFHVYNVLTKDNVWGLRKYTLIIKNKQNVLHVQLFPISH